MRRASINFSRIPAAATCVVGLGVTLPISTAADNVLLYSALLAWFVSAHWRSAFLLLRNSVIAHSAFGLIGLIVVGTLYSSNAKEAWDHAGKYADIAFIVLFLLIFSPPERRKAGLMALAAGLLLTLIVSYAIWLGLIPGEPVFRGDVSSPLAFKLRTTHNILVAFGAFLFSVLAMSAPSSRTRWLWTIAALFAVFNVTVMVQGATGYLVLAALAVLLFATRFGMRGMVLGAAAAIAAAALLYGVSDKFGERIDSIASEYRSWDPAARSDTSTGQRLEFYSNTAKIIAAHPLIGVGTGGFPAAYAKLVEGTPIPPTRNPHSDFLGFAVQWGVVGFLALVAYFIVLWRVSRQIPDEHQRILARGLVLTMVVGCAFNSLLLDHTEGLFFAWMTGLLYAGVQSPPSRTDA